MEIFALGFLLCIRFVAHSPVEALKEFHTDATVIMTVYVYLGSDHQMPFLTLNQQFQCTEVKGFLECRDNDL